MASSSHRQHSTTAEEEWLHLVEAAYPILLKWLQWKESEEYAREEILCETRAKSWSEFHRWDRERSFTYWVFGILKHEAQQYQRREQRKGGVSANHEQFDEELHAGAGAEAGASIEAKMDWEKIKSVLSVEEQMILFYHFSEEMSYREIADILAKNEQAVRQQGYRAKEKLKLYFPELYGLY